MNNYLKEAKMFHPYVQVFANSSRNEEKFGKHSDI
jgi:hypothetical protein